MAIIDPDEIGGIIDPDEEIKSQLGGTAVSKKPGWINPARVGLEAVGAIGGGLIGVTGGPVGALAGAGLGYAGMKGLADIGEEALGYKKTVGLPERTIQSAKDVATGAAMEAVGQVTGTVLSNIYRGGEKYINHVIDWGIEKGLRPSVSGKATFGQLGKYMERAREGVKTIISNKNNLTLTDEAGNMVKGELPKNLNQFSQAISQSKKEIFSKYDEMAGEAGKVAIDTNSIGRELQTIAKDKVVNDFSPSVANYAKERATALSTKQIIKESPILNAQGQPFTEITEKGGKYTALEIQDAIAHLNNSLDAFYKNPSYENASKAYIDSMIANRLRKSLDNTIEGAVGKGYQELKNTYGALSTIEKDVTHRAIVDSRKNIKGLIDFSDIFSGGEVVRGILSMNPATVGQGAAMKVISGLYKHWNNPNRIVSSMFSKVEQNLIKHPVVSKETGRLLGTTGGYVGLTPQMEE